MQGPVRRRNQFLGTFHVRSSHSAPTLLLNGVNILRELMTEGPPRLPRHLVPGGHTGAHIAQA